MKKILFRLLIITFSVSLYADQAAWVTKREASKASEFVIVGDDIYLFCEPCGDSKPVKQKVESKMVKSVGTKRLYELQINNKGVDLAYIYVRHDSKYKNLAILTDIPVTGVSETLNLQPASNDFNLFQEMIGELMLANMVISYDLINSLMVSYSEDNSETYKRVSDRQIIILTDLIEKFDKNKETLFPEFPDDGGSLFAKKIIALMDDLLAAYSNYSNYIEFKDQKMIDKVHYYIKSYDDQFEALLNENK